MRTLPALHMRMIYLCFTLLLAPLVAQAQNLMIGFNRVECLPQSDTLVSVPFMKHPIAASLAVTAAPDLSLSDQASISHGGTNNWTANSLKDNHYIRFTSGAKAGHWFDVTANTASVLTIDLNGESGAGLAAGDKFLLVEYWTLDSLFPPATQTTVHVSEGNLGYQQKTKVLLPNVADEGIDLPADAVFFLTASGWRQSAPGYPAAGATILPPGLPFIVRHPVGVTATSFEPEGRVLRTADAVGLARNAALRQDNAVAVLRPIGLALKDSGLDNNSFQPSASHEATDRKDELLVFNNTATGFNKRPSATYYKLGSSWFREEGRGDGNPAADMEKALVASGGIIVRKAQGPAESATWKNQPTY